MFGSKLGPSLPPQRGGRVAPALGASARPVPAGSIYHRRTALGRATSAPATPGPGGPPSATFGSSGGYSSKPTGASHKGQDSADTSAQED